MINNELHPQIQKAFEIKFKGPVKKGFLTNVGACFNWSIKNKPIALRGTWLRTMPDQTMIPFDDIKENDIYYAVHEKDISKSRYVSEQEMLEIIKMKTFL